MHVLGEIGEIEALKMGENGWSLFVGRTENDREIAERNDLS
jgi:hypothetical protein